MRAAACDRKKNNGTLYGKIAFNKYNVFLNGGEHDMIEIYG